MLLWESTVINVMGMFVLTNKMAPCSIRIWARDEFISEYLSRYDTYPTVALNR